MINSAINHERQSCFTQGFQGICLGRKALGAPVVGFIVFHMPKVGKGQFFSCLVCLRAAVAARNWVMHIKFYHSFEIKSGQYEALQKNYIKYPASTLNLKESLIISDNIF